MNARSMLGLCTAFAALAALATPVVSNVTMSQDADSGEVTIAYELSGAPAIVTVDIQTNGASIGGKYLRRMSGDFARLIQTDGRHEIVWLPDLPWADSADTAAFNLRAEVLAGTMADPPDILVADLQVPSNVCFYSNIESLPGGLLVNTDYRTTKLVMKRVRAKNVTWTRGCVSEPGYSKASNSDSEGAHAVTLTNDYYLGIFEFTQAQADAFGAGLSCYFKGLMRPCDNVTYSGLRGSAASSYYPLDPDSSSILGKLRKRTGLKFDIPSESQWEFAARGGATAGHGDGFWGDGTAITATGTCPNLTPQARYKANAYTDNGDGSVTTNGTAVVGSYKPNDLGFYDMAGNVRERCLDYWQGANDYNGVVTPSNGKNVKALSGAVNVYWGTLPAGKTEADRGKYIHEVCTKAGHANGNTSFPYYNVGDLFPGGDRVWRGGCWSDGSSNCRPRVRNGWSVNSDYTGTTSRGDIGFRVVLTIE